MAQFQPLHHCCLALSVEPMRIRGDYFPATDPNEALKSRDDWKFEEKEVIKENAPGIADEDGLQDY